MSTYFLLTSSGQAGQRPPSPFVEAAFSRRGRRPQDGTARDWPT